MTIISLESGSLEDREKLLEAADPEVKAEELEVEFEKIEDEEELEEHLSTHYDEQGLEGREAERLTSLAIRHLRPALDGQDVRVLYDQL
jgi:hypothetical protein